MAETIVQTVYLNHIVTWALLPTTLLHPLPSILQRARAALIQYPAVDEDVLAWLLRDLDRAQAGLTSAHDMPQYRAMTIIGTVIMYILYRRGWRYSCPMSDERELLITTIKGVFCLLGDATPPEFRFRTAALTPYTTINPEEIGRLTATAVFGIVKAATDLSNSSPEPPAPPTASPAGCAEGLKKTES